MREFSWNYFALTGDVESYLLYKEIGGGDFGADLDEDDAEQDEPEARH